MFGDVVSVTNESQILQGRGNLDDEFIFNLSSMGRSNWRVFSNGPIGPNLHFQELTLVIWQIGMEVGKSFRILKHSVIQTKKVMAWTAIEGGCREEMVTLRGSQIQDVFWK